MANNLTQIVISARDDASAVIGRVGNSLRELSASADGLSMLKGSLAALAGAFSVGSMFSFSKGLIDAADSVGDMSQRLGIGVKSLGVWQLAAESSGTSLEAVGKGVKSLAKNMLDHADALREAGITATNANDAMVQIADLFAEMPDGIEKTTLATQLFGKAGVDMIPMLNLGSKGLQEAKEKAEAYAAALEKLAPKADEFNDKVAELGVNAKASAINGLLPMMDGLIGLSQWLNDAAKGGRSLADALDFLAEKTETPWWMKLSPTGLVSPFAKMQAESLRAKTGRSWEGKIDRQAEVDPEKAKKEADALAAAEKLRKSLGGGDTEKKGSSAYANTLKLITEKNANLALEAQSTDRLTEAQRLALKVMTDIQGGYLLLSNEQKRTVASKLEEMLVNDRLNESTEARRKSLKEEAKATEEYLREEEKARLLVEDFIGDARQRTERQGADAAMIGMRERERQVVAAIRAEEDAAASARKQAYANIKDPQLFEQAIENINQALIANKKAAAEAAGQNYDLSTSWRAGIDSGISAYLDEITNMAATAQEAVSRSFKGMEDSLVNFVKTGKLDFKSLADSIISDMIRMQVQQGIMKPLAEMSKSGGGLLSSLGNMIAGAFGGGRASGGAVDAGKFYLVGEKGPELLMAGSNGTVVPNSALQGLGGGGMSVVIQQTISVDARSDRASIMAAMVQAKEAAKAEIMDSMRRGGAFARA